MSKFFMMIGLPGSGKSTIAKTLADEYQAVIISSDDIRAELYGNAEVQDNPAVIFNIMQERTIQNINKGISVIYDATNLQTKKRKHTLSLLRNCEKIAVLVLTPYKECLKRNNSRDRVVPEEVIRRMYMSFQTPHVGEGFDNIWLKYTDKTKLPFSDITNMNNISHDSIYHQNTIGEHMKIAANLYLNDTSKIDMVLHSAVRLHDIGKPFTKTFTNTHGEITSDAHYYNHNNVGAYDSFFYNIYDGLSANDKVNIALLIQYHMNYYMSWKSSTKSEAKDKTMLGPYLSESLDILHKYDLLAH